MSVLGGLEILLACLGGIIVIGLPVAVLVGLYLIYDRLGKIEKALKKDD